MRYDYQQDILKPQSPQMNTHAKTGDSLLISIAYASFFFEITECGCPDPKHHHVQKPYGVT